jgi:hypothetical protein
MIDAHWIATDPESAEQCYKDHLQHGRMLLADAITKHPDFYEDIELPEFSPEERKKLDDYFGKWGSGSWTRQNLHKRVAAVEHHWKDEAGRRTLRFFHDFAHRENNQTLHVSSAGLNAVVEDLSDQGDLTIRVGPREDMLDKALFGSFWILDNLIGLILDHFEIEVDDAKKKELFSAQDFVKLSDEQMRETGRNDPCPCGSGIKFKRCHGA